MDLAGTRGKLACQTLQKPVFRSHFLEILYCWILFLGFLPEGLEKNGGYSALPPTWRHHVATAQTAHKSALKFCDSPLNVLLWEIQNISIFMFQMRIHSHLPFMHSLLSHYFIFVVFKYTLRPKNQWSGHMLWGQGLQSIQTPDRTWDLILLSSFLDWLR